TSSTHEPILLLFQKYKDWLSSSSCHFPSFSTLFTFQNQKENPLYPHLHVYNKTVW
ncbi:26635_t:CDS:1, partial [Racocetra persica]